MTIAKRLGLLLAVPLMALLGLAIATRMELSEIEANTRFVAESRIAALATVGNLSRSFVEMRVDLRSCLLGSNQSERAAARTAFEQHEQEFNRLLNFYADKLVFSDQGRRLLGEFQTIGREWITSARAVMSLA